MDMATIREWLIQNGIDEHELDNIEELPVIRDIGDGLVLALISADDLANALLSVLVKTEELEQRIAELEARIDA